MKIIQTNVLGVRWWIGVTCVARTDSQVIRRRGNGCRRGEKRGLVMRQKRRVFSWMKYDGSVRGGVFGVVDGR